MNKTRQFFAGRRGQWKRLKNAFPRESSRDILWVHCASLGEFEQGRPVMEAFRVQYPGSGILLTFFSPSGYEVRKNYKGADYVFYLPLDSPWNAARFLNVVKPAAALFVKYEYWYFYLTALRRRHIPTYLFSAIFRPQQPFFKWYGMFHRQMLTCYTRIFVQDNSSADLLKENIKLPLPVTVAGDTRFDRVVAITKGDKTPAWIIERMATPLLVAGSTWPEDEDMLARLLEEIPHFQLILAPHEIHAAHLTGISARFAKWNPEFYSAPQKGSCSRVLVIDCMGLLSSLYRHATLCYIGGGFNPSGIHNTLEAAVHGKPVLFGPNYKKFREAAELTEIGAARSYTEYAGLLSHFRNWLDNPESMQDSGKKAAAYVRSRTGATSTILETLADRVR